MLLLASLFEKVFAFEILHAYVLQDSRISAQTGSIVTTPIDTTAIKTRIMCSLIITLLRSSINISFRKQEVKQDRKRDARTKGTTMRTNPAEIRIEQQKNKVKIFTNNNSTII